MSAGKTAYFQGLRELAGKPIFVGNGEHDLEKEVKENMVCIDMTAAMAKECSISDLLRFFDLLTEDRRLQLKKNHGRKMKFYAWFDEQSGQLCANLISRENATLPLKAEIQNSSLIDILTRFLSAKKSGSAVLAVDAAPGLKKEGTVSTLPALDVFQVVL